VLRLGLAEWTGRAGPPTADWVAAAGGVAFPSGHTTTSAAVAVLVMTAARHRRIRAASACAALTVVHLLVGTDPCGRPAFTDTSLPINGH
jgi:membrane-associated phospholipid phosphatase